MRNTIKLLTIAAFISISFITTLANSTYSAAASALSAKIREDLAVKNVNIKFSKVEIYNASKSLVGFKGQGIANNLNINFDVKLTKIKLVPTSIDYSIFESESAPAMSDEQVNREILEKIHKDFNTKNIVLAVDYFDSENIGENRAKVYGYGEISINFQWRKIKFEITRNLDAQESVNINYQIQ